ncbi:hypothetical protein ABE28_004675 [Peribacillus muralis]|uniref:Uncharacterized protein n=1 Tax=Peribacillus muralis TaxID=264697 RepID=A0A1B3XK96_9BACI|nr:hypothetical protein ABE28_004675 [Peribacillus muralis]
MVYRKKNSFIMTVQLILDVEFQPQSGKFIKISRKKRPRTIFSVQSVQMPLSLEIKEPFCVIAIHLLHIENLIRLHWVLFQMS